MKSFYVLCLTSLFVIAGCSENQEQAQDASGQWQGKLILTGSSTVAPLANEIAKRFEQLHPSTRIDVQTGGSSRGIADARRGTADIGMASRALAGDESDLTAHPIAVDGVGMIVHRDNPVKALTGEQIIGIYTGQIKNWSAVGGRDAPITVVNKPEGRATLEVFLKHFELTSEQIRASIVIGDNQQGIRTVANDPNAIGYVSIGTAEYEQQRDTPIRLLPLEGVEASTQNLVNGTYPMARPLNLVTHGEATALTKAFIAYAQSDQVHGLIRGQSFVPVDSATPATAQATRP